MSSARLGGGSNYRSRLDTDTGLYSSQSVLTLPFRSIRKVAAVSGDARRALDICRRATEIAEARSGRGPAPLVAQEVQGVSSGRHEARERSHPGDVLIAQNHGHSVRDAVTIISAHVPRDRKGQSVCTYNDYNFSFTWAEIVCQASWLIRLNNSAFLIK